MNIRYETLAIHLLTASILILTVMLMRMLLGKRVSQRFRYALWLVVVLKLLIPVTFENPWNLLTLIGIGWPGNTAEVSLTAPGTAEVSLTASGAEERASSDGSISSGSSSGQAAESAEQSPVSAAGAGRSSSSEARSKTETTGRLNHTVSNSTGFRPLKGDIQKPQGFDIRFLMTLIWILGALSMLALFWFSNRKFYKELRQIRIPISVYRDKLPVYRADGLRSPCLFGFFRPAIYLPAGEELDSGTEEYVLLHEWTHYRHRDLFWNLVRCACLCLYWFHPLVWLAARQSLQDSELACDEGVVRSLKQENGKNYGLALLSICRQESGTIPGAPMILATEMIGGKSEMRKRIEAIAYHGYQKRRFLIPACAGILLAACVTFGTIVSGNSASATSGGGSATSDGGSATSDGGSAISGGGSATSDGKSAISGGGTAASDGASDSASGSGGTSPTDNASGQKGISTKEKASASYYADRTDAEIQEDLDRQLALIADQSQLWTGEPTLEDYTISDLDQNGRLEILSNNAAYGSTTYFSLLLFEVSEDRTSLEPVQIDGLSESDATAGWKSPHYSIEQFRWTTAYYDPDTGFYHFVGWGDGTDGAANELDFWKAGSVVYHRPKYESDNAAYYKGMTAFSVYVYNFRLASDGDQGQVLTDKEEIKAMISTNIGDFRAKELSIEAADLDYDKIYQDFITKKKKEGSLNAKYQAVTANDLLLLARDAGKTEDVDAPSKTVYWAVSAEVYAYDPKKQEVIYIGNIESTGSAYPIECAAGYLITGFHHASEHLAVVNGVGIVERVEGFNMDEEGYYAESRYTVEHLRDGTRTPIRTVKITDDILGSMDYYNIYNDEHCIVNFLPIKK